MKESKKKVEFVENVKMPMESVMLGTTERETFQMFIKNTWIGGSGALCHITNNGTGLFDVIEVNKSVQGS